MTFDAAARARRLTADWQATGAPLTILVTAALTAAYAEGAASHVEHHRCDRCYAAGVAAALTKGEQDMSRYDAQAAEQQAFDRAYEAGRRHGQEGAYDKGHADGVKAERAACADLADNWPPECLADPENENCGPGIAEAIRDRGAAALRDEPRGG